MIFASAQTRPHRFNTEQNLQDHYQFIKIAADHDAGLIIFPEMSVTGYERDKAGEMAFTADDARLNEFKKLSAGKNMIIIAGAPVKMNSLLYIGSFIFLPDGSLKVYTKQFLHGSEENYFQSSVDFNVLIPFEGERIAPAICADIDHPEHPKNAAVAGATMYFPSIFFSPGGIPDAYNVLSGYAQKHSMHVLMSNFCIGSWGRPSGGKSAFWNNRGELIGSLNESDPGILLVEKSENSFYADEIYL
jgi:predicted amidohydrolase